MVAIFKRRKKVKIALACDHGAIHFKSALFEYLESKGHIVQDFGTDSTESCDYPDYGVPAAESVQKGKNDRAILTCTNGIGMSMVANKLNGIRAALVYNTRTAETTRKHHDSNVLCMGAQDFENEQLLAMVEAWLTTEFEGGRHQRRVEKYPKI